MNPSDFAPASVRPDVAGARGARAPQVVAAWLLLLLIDVAGKLLGFWTMYRLIGRAPIARRRPSDPAVTTQQACEAVDAACTRYVRQVYCLQSAAAAVCLMRLHGLPAQLVIGIRRPPFDAHAWVEIEGQAVMNDRSGLSRYHTIARC
jgi:hypothetical protein